MSTVEKGQLLGEVSTLISDPGEKLGRRFSGLSLGTACQIWRAMAWSRFRQGPPQLNPLWPQGGLECEKNWMPDRCRVSQTPALTSHLRTTGGEGGTRGNHPRHQAQRREAARPVDRPGPGWAGGVDATPMLSPRVGKGAASSPREHTPFVRTDVTPGPVAELPIWISLTGAVTVVPAPAGAQELPGHFLRLQGLRGLEGRGWVGGGFGKGSPEEPESGNHPLHVRPLPSLQLLSAPSPAVTRPAE